MMNRGDAAAGTWIFRGFRRRAGARPVQASSSRRYPNPPRPTRDTSRSSAGSRRRGPRRGCAVGSSPRCRGLLVGIRRSRRRRPRSAVPSPTAAASRSRSRVRPPPSTSPRPSPRSAATCAGTDRRVGPASRRVAATPRLRRGYCAEHARSTLRRKKGTVSAPSRRPPGSMISVPLRSGSSKAAAAGSGAKAALQSGHFRV